MGQEFLMLVLDLILSRIKLESILILCRFACQKASAHQLELLYLGMKNLFIKRKT